MLAPSFAGLSTEADDGARTHDTALGVLRLLDPMLSFTGSLVMGDGEDVPLVVDFRVGGPGVMVRR
ncbi:MAG: hypothetical protein M3546_17195 [Actinomycetota bacterium]|nr:hypothetical protein [Actinomycetota bacterium]